MQFKNPIIPGFHPDPSICRVGEDYYIVTSSFEFLPGLPIFHSKDLINWKQIGHCLTRPEQMEFPNCMSTGGIFAPTIRYHQGTFYVVSTNVYHEGAMAPGGSGNFIVTATDPAGEWSSPIWVSQGGIDPSLFWDDDGKVYFTSTIPALNEVGNLVNAIWQAEINPDTGELLTESKIISYGCGGRFAEGPHIYKKDGYYYLLLAEGGTEFGHMETISRSKSIWGPFENCPHNPILTASQENDPTLAATGHADLVEAHDGSWWVVFLCYRLSENYYHHMGRETSIAPVQWIDGWPVIYDGKTPQVMMEAECLPQKSIMDETPIRTHFAGQELGLEWNFIRTYYNGFSVTDHPGYLTLKGNAATLSDKATPAFIGRRIDNFEFRAETLIGFEPEKDGEEAGIAIAHTTGAHYEFVLTKKDGVKKALVRKTLFDMTTETYYQINSEGPAHLQIIGDRYDVIFNIMIDGTYIEVGRGLVKLLSSEMAGGCLGTYVGMYASGNGKEMTTGAKYEWFDYERLPEKEKKPMFFSE
ncbi:glycoside hydrolase family 43 protein [Neobacillus cucumis]|uniref:glycoside hydrolase family 43 protein n=1 Tax=Neobacillus cucumis TaxID=1740721 RepID=UPI0028531408|nr:glycoside hydrolase family 43 protein [Neobacillus cucumis]MDR4946752.1 glycoside hydrolase family 43 protein [Neobacillus cucumis]